MTETLQVLGQSTPSADTLTTIYTVPSSTEARVFCMVVCNRSNQPTRFRIAVSPSGASIANSHYQYYDKVIEAQDSKPFLFGSMGITLAATDVVRVYNYDAVCSFSLHGSEIT